MGLFADRISDLDIRRASPDGGIAARLRHDDEFRIWFVGRSYQRYQESELERQLQSLTRAVLVARRRARLTTLSRALGRPVRPGGARPDGPRDRRFRDQQAKLAAVGRTPFIEVTASPGDFWRIRITPGTTARLDEERFLSELHAAVTRAVTGMRRDLLKLREDVFGQRLPAPPRDEETPWR